MRIMITGAGGMLGSDLFSLLSGQHEMVIGLNSGDLDITDFSAVERTVRDHRPDVVINAAAYTNVDGCEDNPDRAFSVNAIGPRNLAVACEAVGAALLSVSTDYVFDGKKPTPYEEYDTPNPRSVYGKSKYAGERLIQSCCRRAYIVRTAWLYGRNGKNFVHTMLKLAESKKLLTVVDDQIGSPTYTVDLANAIASLIRTPSYGIYHFTNSGYCSWYEFARHIFNEAGIEIEVQPCTTEEFPRPAPRPPFSKLLNRMGPLSGVPALRNWRDAVGEYVRLLKTREMSLK